MKKLQNIAAVWLPIAVVTTVLCGLVFVAVQQSLRQSANDPQIEMAGDAADALTGGASAESVLPPTSIDVARSLSPFTEVFNENGEVIAASGMLHGQPLQLPSGVLEDVRQQGESRLTLQPEPAARMASVIIHYGGPRPGFVLVGRSIREIEFRTSQTRIFVGIAWLVSLVVTFLVVFATSSETIWQ